MQANKGRGNKNYSSNNIKDTITIAEYLDLQEEEVVVADRELIEKRLSDSKSGAIGNINVDAKLLEDNKQDSGDNGNSNENGNGSQLRKFAQLTHVEANVLFKNMNSLAIATLANALVLTLNDAISATVSENLTNNSYVVLTYWIAAFIETILTLVFSFQLTKLLIKKEKEIYSYIINHGIENSRKQLISYRSQFRICISTVLEIAKQQTLNTKHERQKTKYCKNNNKI